MGYSNKKKILIGAALTLLVIIILVIILLIINGNKAESLYNTWSLYKTEIVRNKEVVHSLDASDIYISFRNDNYANICTLENDERVCKFYSYSFKDNLLIISKNESNFYGNFKYAIKGSTLTLEKIEDESTKTSIKHYFKKTVG